jgi:hypothetical protein
MGVILVLRAVEFIPIQSRSMVQKVIRPLIEAGAPGWSYLDDGSDQGTSWREPSYDDSLWGIGDAPLGFGSVNNHPFGGPWINPDRNTTVYFRKEFEITNANLITEATARVMSDGGAIVYLNGVEIARDNMPG